MPPARGTALGLVVFCSVLCCTGCDSGPKLYPVSGTVTVGGKPAPGALVFLHPKGGRDVNAPVPYGKAGDDGRFTVTTVTDGDGAAAGEYVVTVVWPDTSKPADKYGTYPDTLNGAYDKPGGSKLTAVVKAEATTLPAIDLPAPSPAAKSAAPKAPSGGHGRADK